MKLLFILFISIAVAVNATPSYEKWGSIAVKETQKRYNNADIIDYQHIGRVNLSPNLSEEKFKLWLRNQEGKEFGVYVNISFDPKTDKLKAISYVETNR
ncbi:MAG: YqzG/YhdC family protein [Gorillibacterium sp.]|nr:YqzG/YhdC family protein [Gorillibacterium sp.]